MPLLIERRVGQGRVLLLTGTVDVDWGNFPLQATYMPLIQSIVRVMGVPDGGEGRRFEGTVGEGLELPIAALTGDVVVEGPEGLVEASLGSGVIRFTPERAGAYRIGVSGLPSLASVAVNMDTAESDVRRQTSLARTAAAVDPDRFMHRLQLNKWAFVLLLVLAAMVAVFAWRLGLRTPEVSDVT